METGHNSPPAGDAPSTDLSSVFDYPTLGRLLSDANRQEEEAMRARLERTVQELERVVRLGTSEEAARAQRALRAYETAVSLLNELGQTR